MCWELCAQGDGGIRDDLEGEKNGCRRLECGCGGGGVVGGLAWLENIKLHLISDCA